ncbi:MAG: DUF4062 domain-containing protein [Ignavibacteriales bacterium]|nr:MAG: DUF4062 domain-containing protein [Ignavibacteriales bacterium]
MNKRYQVFVSSTYQDLILERNEVMKALLELDCIPCGMEYFPAANEDQWSYIKKLIEECDYYIVITAGKYGSQDELGISYTQKEYEYAIEKGIPVIGFLHNNINKLSLEKSETDVDTKKKLDEFHKLVKCKLCRFWESPEELGSVVSRSLTQEIKRNPRIGWIKADRVLSENAAEEILLLKKKNEELSKDLELALLRPPQTSQGLAQGEDIFEFTVDVFINYRIESSYWNKEQEIGQYRVQLSWNDIFINSTSKLLNEKRESSFKTYVNQMPKVFEYLSKDVYKKINEFEKRIETDLKKNPKSEKIQIMDEFKYKIKEEDFQTIKIQLIALGLLELSKDKSEKGSVISLIKISPYGEKKLIQLKAVKSNV